MKLSFTILMLVPLVVLFGCGWDRSSESFPGLFGKELPSYKVSLKRSLDLGSVEPNDIAFNGSNLYLLSGSKLWMVNSDLTEFSTQCTLPSLKSNLHWGIAWDGTGFWIMVGDGTKGYGAHKVDSSCNVLSTLNSDGTFQNGFVWTNGSFVSAHGKSIASYGESNGQLASTIELSLPSSENIGGGFGYDGTDYWISYKGSQLKRVNTTGTTLLTVDLANIGKSKTFRIYGIECNSPATIWVVMNRSDNSFVLYELELSEYSTGARLF